MKVASYLASLHVWLLSFTCARDVCGLPNGTNTVIKDGVTRKNLKNTERSSYPDNHRVSLMSAYPHKTNITLNETQCTIGQGNSSYILHGHRLNQQFATFAVFCFVLIIIVAVVCNSALVFTIATIRKLRTYTNVLVINLAVSDVITAVGSITFDVDFMLRGYFSHGNILCGLMQTSFLVSLPSSMLAVSLLTAERFVAITRPFRHNNIVTRKRVVTLLAIEWVYVVLLSLFPILYNMDGDAVHIICGMCHLKFPMGYQFFQVIVNFCLPIVFMFVAYTKVYIITHRLTKENLPTKMATITASIGFQSTLMGFRKPSSFNVVPTALLRNIKAAKRIALLVCICLICWLVYIIMVVTNYACLCHPRELTWLANIINYSSTALNPVVYGLLTKDIRNAAVRLFCRGPFLSRFQYKRPSHLENNRTKLRNVSSYSSVNSTQC